MSLALEEPQEVRTFFNQQLGLNQLYGTFPCLFDRNRPHPVASVEGRRLARFRRKLEAGIVVPRERGYRVRFLTLAMRYDVDTGKTEGNLRYSTQRFIQKLRRKGIELEYARVTELTAAGARNHVHLVVVSKQELPGDHDLKDLWAASTYGTSYQVQSAEVKDVGVVARYMAKALGAYMTKQGPEGLDSSDQTATAKTALQTDKNVSNETLVHESGINEASETSHRGGSKDVSVEPSGTRGGQEIPSHEVERLQKETPRLRVSTYATFSRGWLPTGAESEWKRIFVERAVIWCCDRGFFHTDLRDTNERWYDWLKRQEWPWKPRRSDSSARSARGGFTW